MCTFSKSMDDLRNFTQYYFGPFVSRIIVLEHKMADNAVFLWEKLYDKNICLCSPCFEGLHAPSKTNVVMYGITSSES